MARKIKSTKLSDQLRLAIDTCGITRYAICKATGIDNATLCRFMQGKHGLTLATIDQIGEFLKLSLVAENQPTAKSQKKKGK